MIVCPLEWTKQRLRPLGVNGLMSPSNGMEGVMSLSIGMDS